MGTISRRTALLITGVLLLGAAVAYVGPQFLSLSSNLCLTSADEVRIENSVLEFSGDRAWVIDAAAGCDNKIIGGETTLDKSTIQTDDAQAERDFTAGMTAFEAWFYQGIQDTRTPVFNTRSMDINCDGVFGCGTDANAQCDSFQAETSYTSPSEFRIEYESGSTSGWRLYCTRVEHVGAVSEWQLAQGSDFQGTFTAEAAGRSDSDTISKQDTTAKIRVGDVNGDGDAEHAHVTWTGSLDGQLESIDLSDFRPVCNNDCDQPTNDVSWIVGSDRLYSSYTAYDDTGFRECVERELANDATHTCVGAYNARSSNVFSDASGAIEQYAGFDVKEVRTRGGEAQVVADRGTAIDRPEFRILTDADWIGFSIPTVDPRFQETPYEANIIGNSQTSVSIPVRNTGETGEMQVYINCPNTPITGGSTTATVAAGDTARFTVDLSAGPTETTEYTCTVTAQDTDIQDTARATELTVHAQTNCPDADGDGVCDQFDTCPDEPGAGSNNGCPLEEICGNEVDDDGDGRVDEDCSGTGTGNWFEKLFSGFGGVGVELGSGLDGFVTDLNRVFANPLGNWLTLFDLVVSFIAAVTAFGIVRLQVVQPFIETVAAASPLSEVQVRLLFGLVFGLLVGYLVYTAISSIVVKAVLLLALLVGGYVYLQVKAAVPG